MNFDGDAEKTARIHGWKIHVQRGEKASGITDIPYNLSSLCFHDVRNCIKIVY